MSITIALIIWTKRLVPGALPLAILMLVTAFWIVIRTFSIAAVDVSDKILLAKILYFASVTTGIFWLFFSLDYTGRNWWKAPRSILAFFLLPCVTLVIMMTSRWQGWNWLATKPGISTAESLVTWSHGPLFWIQSVYVFSLFLTGIIILWRYATSGSKASRILTAAILLGTVFPILSHTSMILDILPEGVPDLTPIALTVTVILYSTALFHFRFIDVVPIARSVLVENIPDGILVLDSNSNIIDINPVGAEIAGHEKSLLLGKNLDTAWPELRLITSQISNGENKETCLETSEGELVFNISLTYIYNNRGDFTGRLLVLRDVTERSLIQKKLESLYEKEHKLSSSLQEEIEKHTAYATAMVHELNTPLTSILASSELLESEIQDKNLLNLVGNLRRSSLYLEQRIVDLIELARCEAGILEINEEPLDISGLIRSVADEMEKSARDKGLSLILDVPELLMVPGDSIRLRQVMASLIGNAIKYSDTGHVLIKVNEYENDTLLVEIKDSGIGIEEDRLEYLFNPYRRKVSLGAKLSGIGIKLALSKMFVELHKGKMWVESTPGAGSSFFFAIPLLREVEES